MAANWRPASIPLTGGLVTGADAKALEPGQFAQLDNVVFDGLGHPEKRHGSTDVQVLSGPSGSAPAVADRLWVQGYGYANENTLIRAATAPGETGSVRGLATRGSELLAYDGTYMVSRSDATAEEWLPVATGLGASSSSTRGTCSIPHLSVDEGWGPVGKGNNYSGMDVAVGEQVTILVWAELNLPTSSNVTIYATARDNVTGATLYQRKAITAFSPVGDTMVRIVYVPREGATGFFCVAQANQSMDDLYVSVALETAPGAWTNTSVTTTVFGRGLDLKAYGGHAYVGWVSTGSTMFLTRVDYLGAIVHFNPPIGNIPYVDTSLGVAFHPDGRLLVVWFRDVGGSLRPFISFFASDLVTLQQGPTQLDTVVWDVTASNYITAEWCLLATTTRAARVFFSAQFTTIELTNFVSVEDTSVAISLDSATRTTFCRLAGSAFRCGNSVGVVLQGSDASGQEFYGAALWDDAILSGGGVGNMQPVALWARGPAFTQVNLQAGVGSVAVIPGQDEKNPLRFAVAVPYAHQNNSNVQLYATVAELDFGAPLRSVQYGSCTYFAGALPREYDGATLHEAGFPTAVQPTLTPSNGAGALTVNSTYTYRVYMCHRNAQGEVVRSSGVVRTVALGAADDTVTITLVPQFWVTRPGWFYEIYRSQANGSVLTLVDTLRHDDWRADEITYTDVTPDSSIASTAIDPLPVGVLDCVSPPACEIIAQGKDRVWMAGGELRPGQVAYSRLSDPGEAMSWNEALVHETDRTSEVTAISFLSDWAMVFAHSRTHLIAGDGPANSGLGDFYPARLVLSDIGALNHESVQLTPLGVAFVSPVGVRVLAGERLLSGDKGQTGSAVDGSFRGRTVIGSVVVPEQSHARWLLDDGTQMVWDFSLDRWTRWTGFQVEPELGSQGGMIYWSAGAAVADQDSVLLESTSTYTDGGRPYETIASLGWISPHGVLSWGRLRRWGLDGDALGSFTMRVYVDYDFKLSRRQEYTWAASTSYAGADGTTFDHDPASWGSGAWGGAVWGGDTSDGGAFPTAVRFNRQKATSFRLTFTDDGEPNATFSLRNLSIEFAPAAGLVRVGGRNI